MPSMKVSNGSAEIRFPVQWLFQLGSPGSTCDHPLPWHGGAVLGHGLPLLLSRAEGYRGTGATRCSVIIILLLLLLLLS